MAYEDMALRVPRNCGDLSSNKAVSVFGRNRISWQAVAKTRNRAVMTMFAIGSCSLTKNRTTIYIARKMLITRTASSRNI